jgi:hypothetical protein
MSARIPLPSLLIATAVGVLSGMYIFKPILEESLGGKFEREIYERKLKEESDKEALESNTANDNDASE